jgi:magnesium transporter
MTAEPTQDLARVIEARDFPALQAMLKHWSPATAAGFIEGLPVEQQVVAFRVLPRDLAADVFEYLPLDAQEQLLKAMAKEEVAKILNEMAPDDRTGRRVWPGHHLFGLGSLPATARPTES